MSLPERNASISYHLTSQPGTGPRASRGLRETPPFGRYSQVIAVYDGGTRRKLFVARFLLRSVFLLLFLGSPVFSSCCGFSVVLAFFEIFGIYADSRFCPRVDSSPQLRVSASRQLAYSGWKPLHLVAVSSTTSTGSSGTSRFRRPAGTSLRPELPGLRFDQLDGFRGPEVATLGHTGSLPGYVVQEVLCPEGGKVSN